MDISKLKTGEISELMNEGKLMYNPLAGKYYCGKATSEFITKKGGYFCVGSGETQMDWAGYCWRLVYKSADHGLKTTGPFIECKGTYLNDIPFEPSQYLKDRAFKHLIFLEKHFTYDYINKIKNYQLSQPLIVKTGIW